MKNYISLLILCGTCVLTSCSNDDDNNSTDNNTEAQITGTYNLTYLGTQEPVDYNDDGTESQNLMNESTCYLDTQITLNEDMTYTATDGYVFFISETGCNTEETSGTWEIEGNTLTLTNTTMGELTSSTEFTAQNNELRTLKINATYPDRDIDGNPVYVNGDLQYTYTKINN